MSWPDEAVTSPTTEGPTSPPTEALMAPPTGAERTETSEQRTLLEKPPTHHQEVRT